MIRRFLRLDPPVRFPVVLASLATAMAVLITACGEKEAPGAKTGASSRCTYGAGAKGCTRCASIWKRCEQDRCCSRERRPGCD